MPLINRKVELSLKRIENCLIATSANANKATFEITDAKLCSGCNVINRRQCKLPKLLGEGFKISIYWNKYKVIDNRVVEIADNSEEKYMRELLDSSCKGIKRLFVLTYYNTEGNIQDSVDSSKIYFLPRVKIGSYNIEIDGKNIYDQPIDDSIKQYDEIRKISTGQGHGYTTGCLLDFLILKKNTD